MIIWQKLNSQQRRQAIARPASSTSAELSASVADIIADVASRGDTALREMTEKFDGVSLDNITLSSERLLELAQRCEARVKAAIDTAFLNIERFHKTQQQTDISIETSPGVNCELRFAPLDSVGLYIPGGTAPLPSTVLMVGIPAMVAGCNRKVLCTPPNKQGLIEPAIAYAAIKCGIEEVNLVGGAQAIAAMAVGTDSIAKVDKLFGPGNAYVTEAKRQASQIPAGPAIDMPAGPSEVLVIADENASAAFVAADLLSQAEHGVDSQAILVTNSADLVNEVKSEVSKQLMQLSRETIAAKAMENARYILATDIAEAIEISNQYAPEHLIVQTQQARNWLPAIKNAGSIFVGAWSPESAGDYASGTNHVLPTYGYARNYSSLGLADFVRRYTVQELSVTGIETIGQAIMDLAEAEGLEAHRNAVQVRLDNLKNTRESKNG